jgi:hypothetical protein
MKTFYIHKLVQSAFNLGKGFIDHINQNRADNHLKNLRVATRSQNLANQKSKRGSSKFKGVSFFKQTKRWEAYIKKDGKRYHLGFFKSEEDAARAYDEVAIEKFKEFAYINFPLSLSNPFSCKSCTSAH